MRIYFSQLSAALDKGLANFYLVTGEEPLQRMEAADMIRAAAGRAGYGNREFFFVERDFDWGALSLSAANMSLFGAKHFLDVRIQTDKIDKRGVEFFKSVIDEPHDDRMFLVQVNKVDGRSAWIKKVTKQAVWLPVYQKDPREMRSWLIERSLRMELVVEEGVIDLIAQYSEGNMLAAAQELDKIKLSLKGATVRLQDVREIVSDGAHYTVWDLADAVITGEAGRALRILRGLQSEGAPMPLLLWALADQFRRMAAITRRLENGERADAVLKTVWRNRQPVYKKAVARKMRAAWWSTLLHGCHQVDRALKGYGTDDSWNELLRVVMRALGTAPLRKPGMASIASVAGKPPPP